MHGYGGMRADQRDDRTMPRRDDQQRRRLRLGPASEYRGPSGLLPGGLRFRDAEQLRQIHQARDRLEHDRIRHAPGLSRGDHAAAGRGAGRDSAEHPVPRRRRQTAEPRRDAFHGRRRPLGGRPGQDRSRARIAGGGRTPADRRRRRNLLVAGRPGAARVRRADLDSGLRAARRPGRGVRGASAGGSRRLQEALHRSRRRGAHAGLPLLERRALRASQDLERQGQIHPGRPDAEPHRMAGAGGSSAGRRSQARAAPDDQSDKGAQARLLEKSQLAVDQGTGRGPLQLRAPGGRERQEVSDQPSDPSGAAAPATWSQCSTKTAPS